jgi:hypothetical protein
MCAAHRLVPVQVTAWVDEGVAELVAALNTMPGVVTLDSCERDPEGLAYVSFRCHCGDVLERASQVLRLAGGAFVAGVSLRALDGQDPGMVTIALPPAGAARLAHAIRYRDLYILR